MHPYSAHLPRSLDLVVAYTEPVSRYPYHWPLGSQCRMLERITDQEITFFESKVFQLIRKSGEKYVADSVLSFDIFWRCLLTRLA